MALAGDDGAALERGDERSAVIRHGREPALRRRLEAVGVGEVGVAFRERGTARPPASRRSIRTGGPGRRRGKRVTMSSMRPRPGTPGDSSLSRARSWRADTDGESRPRPVHALLQGFGRAGTLESLHRRAERADAGKHHVPGLEDLPGRTRQARRAAATPEAGHDGCEVGGSRAADDDVMRVHRLSLVLGISSCPSWATAFLRATASALKAASARWWSFVPRSRST